MYVVQMTLSKPFTPTDPSVETKMMMTLITSNSKVA